MRILADATKGTGEIALRDFCWKLNRKTKGSEDDGTQTQSSGLKQKPFREQSEVYAERQRPEAGTRPVHEGRRWAQPCSGEGKTSARPREKLRRTGMAPYSLIFLGSGGAVALAIRETTPA